ncbi:MAG TPA: phage major capsid protein [Candidatus Scalindua sp.]|nr:phage major capsid protein [Candidatus Scalindua sp.]
MDTNQEILALAKENVQIISDVQEKVAANEKKYDGLVEGEIKNLIEKSATLVEEVNVLHDQQKADKEAIENMKKELARPTAGSEQEVSALKEYNKEMAAYMRKGSAPTMDALDAACKEVVIKSGNNKLDTDVESVVKTMQVGVNPDGGFLVFPDRITNFRVDRIFETSPVRAVARVITTASDQVEIIIDDNEATSGGWVGETQNRPTTDTPQIGQETIATHEQFAQPALTQKFLDDSSIDPVQFINDKVTDILTRTENTAFVIGDGSQKPKGFLTYDAWAAADTYERNAVEQIDSGSADNVTYDGFVDTQNALKDAYQSSAVWMMKRTTWGNVLKLKDGESRPLINFEQLAEDPTRVVLGKRVLFADDMPVVASDALSVVFGDFGVGYTIVDRLGIRVLRDAFTNKPLVLFYTTKRVGGAVTNFEALKIMKLAA